MPKTKILLVLFLVFTASSQLHLSAMKRNFVELPQIEEEKASSKNWKVAPKKQITLIQELTDRLNEVQRDQKLILLGLTIKDITFCFIMFNAIHPKKNKDLNNLIDGIINWVKHDQKNPLVGDGVFVHLPENSDNYVIYDTLYLLVQHQRIYKNATCDKSDDLQALYQKFKEKLREFLSSIQEYEILMRKKISKENQSIYEEPLKKIQAPLKNLLTSHKMFDNN